MAKSKQFIAEMVLYRLSGGYTDVSFSVQMEDVWAALEQKINAKFKMEQFNVTMPSGETLPENSMLAYYEGIAVTSNGNGTSKCTLPILPIALPRSMGVYMITDDKDEVTFIPLLAGQKQLLAGQPLINDLLGQVGYTQRGKRIDFTKDLPLLGKSTVNMSLVVMDINTYSITEDLPIPADMIDVIIDELVAKFSVVSPEAGLVNNISNIGQNQPVK